ncbi:hypothetical protein [Streptomyces sp. NBC_01422]|uniref:hypothetical protein n=1 Tax=Streptomyces sp. NBC_01422 TaxID=2903859 RepID=UPI002E2C60B1|nr:hypothetical protein [Streptomyces sp. NBC_01422]
MPTRILTAEDGTRIVLISCVLRQATAGAGWEVLADAGHSPSGVTGVIQHPTYLELTHDVSDVQVSSVQVTPDEYWAARGLRPGVSVGLPWTKVFLFSGTSTTPVNPAAYASPTGNLWITGFLEVPAPATSTKKEI